LWWQCLAPAAALPTSRRQPERLLTLVPAPGAGRLEDHDVTVTVRWVREAGRVVRTVVCLRDTAARTRAERDSADVVSTVAHELRSPLTSVKGFTATLLSKWDRFPDEVKLQMLATVNADADRVTRLLSELLDVSRIDSGRLEVRRQVVDLPSAVERVIAGRVADGAEIDRFALDVDGALPELWLDPDKVDQILANLVENALRHGAGRVHLSVGPLSGESMPAAGGPGAIVVIADEGDGIAEDQLARVFTKFWRGGERRGGTGLGLYVVRGLVEALGGRVEVSRSEKFGGAEFRLLLPAGSAPYLDAAPLL
jgi:signal transduction histidine kinase